MIYLELETVSKICNWAIPSLSFLFIKKLEIKNNYLIGHVICLQLKLSLHYIISTFKTDTI